MKPRISPVLQSASYTYLSKQTGYTRTHIRRSLMGLNRLSIECMVQIAREMNITMDEVYWHIEKVKEQRQLSAMREAGELTKNQLKRASRIGTGAQ